MRHLAIYTKDAQFATVITLLRSHSIPCEYHVNRTRFWLDVTHPLYSYMALVCKDVTNERNHAVGI